MVLECCCFGDGVARMESQDPTRYSPEGMRRIQMEMENVIRGIKAFVDPLLTGNIDLSV